CCFHSCRDKEIINKIDPAFAKYIDAYTTGTVSKTSTIRIRLAAEVVTTHPVGEVPADELFDFSPSVKGKAIWVDARTIEFHPSENLKPGQLYQISFQLGKVTKTESGYEKFTFNLQVVKPSFQVTSFGLRATNEKDSMYLPGVLETADIEEDAAVEKLLTASSWKGNLAVSWQHNNDQKVHNFKVENVRRNEKAEKLELEWNGDPLDIDIKGHESIEIPATGDFKVLDITSMNDAQQYASVQFSSMIAVGQELSGLITISNQQDISYTINGSEVKVYGDNKLDGNYTVEIHSGIKNIYGDTLQNGFTANVFFENRLPSVSIRGRGNILPNTGKLVLPFESVNLNAVDINIIKIYENNIPQFLQNNDLGGNEDLRRVAIPVVQKTLRLDDDKTVDLHRRQRFSLDIDKFLKTEPGAIYRVTIGFRPAYSLYECHEESSGENGNGNSNAGNADYEIIPAVAGADDNFWDRYDDYYPYGYDWNMRDNPCANSYYNKDRWASRNIIASNIGIIAKRTGGNQISVAVSDLLTTKPLANIELEILDFQQQVIAKANSDNEGFAMFKLERKPFLVIAKREGEKGYLRLDDGGSLPLSRFDISGEEVSSGIKGFVFGERGVWRPGDSLFLNCIIEDDDQTLPAGHPVELALFTPRGLLYKKLIQPNETEGFNVFRTAIDANAPTGNWLAKFSVGGATFEKRLRIETVMPNRLKVNLDFGRDAILGKGTSATGTLSARWLFGAIAKNLKAKIDASFYSTKTAFPKYAGFSFDDPTSGYSTQSKTIFDGPLDAEGNARINTAFDSDGQAPGMLTAKFAVKVFEPGGGFSIDNVSVPYSPYESYAGIKLPEGEKPWGLLLTGKDYTTQIINVDNRGALLPGSREVQVQLYKIQWRWWWDNNGDDLSNFTQDKYNKLIKTEMVHLTNGKGQWGFHINDNDWGRYLVFVKDLKSGHKAGGTIYVEQPGWQSRENMDDPTAASMLSFTSDKDKYATGDDITITIPTSKGGRALMSIESGSKVLRMFWVNTDQGQTLVKFKAEENMAPNIYVNVSLLQPHSQTANDLPIRMYGVLPLAVENKKTILSPVITMANIIRPEQPSTVTVSEQQGREMTYSIAIVDDGLLDLTHFNTPDPHNYFYAKEALGVKTWDLYDNVIGAWGGNLERILTIGGDEGGSGPIAEAKANRFKPIVKYLGPFHL
ncbi:MAG: MG2 domain-containing protein, partial [Ginsengibacter sp.]